MDFSSVKAITIPEGIVKKIVAAGKTIWQAVTYKNWVRYSTESDGTTIYNGGLGYKEGWRVRSGGAEAESSFAVCTGFIPFKKGDILRISPKFSGQNTVNTLNFSDSSFTNLGQYNDNTAAYGICTEDSTWRTGIATETGGITVIDISSVSNGDNIAYIRLTHALNFSPTADDEEVRSGSELIVTVNEEIT